MGRAMEVARAASAVQGALPPPLPVRKSPAVAAPPPLPTRTFATIQESAAAAKEQLDVKLAANLLDPAELERFAKLVVFARTAVESRHQGRHKSPDHGGGGEFSEYKGYEPGQPVADIDWRVFARSRKLVIRRFRQETDMDVHLLVDASGSMGYHGTCREVKGRRAARVAAALAYLMMKQGDKASLTLFADRVLDHLPSGGTRRHLTRMLRSLVRPAHEPAGRTDVSTALAECDRLLRRRGRLVVLSDFMGARPVAVFESLAPFIHRRFQILLLRVLDPDELTLPNAPLARFIDMETNESIELEPAEIRADYEARMRRTNVEFASLGARHRVDFATLDTAAPYREAIEAYLGFRHPAR
jgi:uncharacterized protein (DUF58 family)